MKYLPVGLFGHVFTQVKSTSKARMHVDGPNDKYTDKLSRFWVVESVEEEITAISIMVEISLASSSQCTTKKKLQ